MDAMQMRALMQDAASNGCDVPWLMKQVWYRAQVEEYIAFNQVPELMDLIKLTSDNVLKDTKGKDDVSKEGKEQIENLPFVNAEILDTSLLDLCNVISSSLEKET